MKRALTFIILLIANIVLLAVTIMPHHHHDKSLDICLLECQIGSCCNIDESTNDHSCSDHQDTGCSEQCVSRQEFVKATTTDFSSSFPIILFLLITTSFLLTIDCSALVFRQKPYILSYISCIVQSTGLRAPPQLF